MRQGLPTCMRNALKSAICRLMTGAIGLAAILSQPAIAQQDQLVVFGPEGPLAEQVRYLTKTWPRLHVIAIVEVTKEPNCSQGASSIHCGAQVKLVELVLAGAGIEKEMSNLSDFGMIYWYPVKTRRRAGPDGKDRFLPKQGDRLVAFLTRTREATLRRLNSVVLMRSSDELVIKVKDAVRAFRTRG